MTAPFEIFNNSIELKNKKYSSSPRAFKDAIFGHLARVGKAVSNPVRVELLELLSQAPRTVEALAKASNQSVANTSQHLRVLKNARFVEAEKRGLFVTYRLADEVVADFCVSLRSLAERRILEIEALTEAFLSERDALEAVDQDDLALRVARSEVTVLDVRPAEEYREAHIAGAISVPLEELEQRFKKLPKRKQIVAYCRGPYCVFAIEAVERLRRSGYDAVRLELGVQDWRARGFAIEGAS